MPRLSKAVTKEDDETLIRQNLKYRDAIPEQQVNQHAQYMEDLNLERGTSAFDFKDIQVRSVLKSPKARGSQT